MSKKFKKDLFKVGVIALTLSGVIASQAPIITHATSPIQNEDNLEMQELQAGTEINVSKEQDEKSELKTESTAFTSKVDYIKADDYAKEMKEKVEPYLDEIRTEDYFSGQADMKIHYEKYITKDATDSIVIVHGLSETTEKFHELIYYFACNKYNVYIMEDRGHGNSDRFIEDDVSKIYVDDYNYYIDDLKTFVDTIVKPDVNKIFGESSYEDKLFMYCHSMGGAIGSVYNQRYDGDFDAVILSCPLLKINTGAIPNFLVKAAVNTLTFFGQGKSYAPTGTPFTPEIDMETSYSSGRERVEYYRDLRVNDDSQKLFGITNKWGVEAFKLMKNAMDKDGVSKINTPVLLFTGTSDTAVINSAHYKFAGYNPDYITHIEVEGGRHELYMESDEILHPYLDNVLSFFEENR